MVFFPVDDQFAFDQKCLLAGNAAVGIWTRAGAECMRTASGGIVIRELGESLGKPSDIKKLVNVRLWHAHGHDCDRCPQPPAGGWVFHDWKDIGTLKTTEQIKSKREADRVRQANWRARQKDVVSHGVTDHVSADMTNGVTHGAPSPSPSVVTSVSPSPSLTRVIRLTDEDIEKIKKRLGCDRRHAIRVADQILDKSAATVARPGRYVLAAIEAEPALYRPAKRNPRKGDPGLCTKPGHSDFAAGCAQCASEEKASPRAVD